MMRTWLCDVGQARYMPIFVALPCAHHFKLFFTEGAFLLRMPVLDLGLGKCA